MSHRNSLFILGHVVYLVIIFGIVCPELISADDNTSVIIGCIVLAVNLVIYVTKLYKWITTFSED